MFFMLKTDGLHRSCGIVDLDVSEEKKGNQKLFLKFLLKKLSILKKWRRIKMEETLGLKNFIII